MFFRNRAYLSNTGFTPREHLNQYKYKMVLHSCKYCSYTSIKRSNFLRHVSRVHIQSCPKNGSGEDRQQTAQEEEAVPISFYHFTKDKLDKALGEVIQWSEAYKKLERNLEEEKLKNHNLNSLLKLHFSSDSSRIS